MERRREKRFETVVPTRSETTADRVRQHLQEDLVVEQALRRGILSLRRAARWLIARKGWDTTEDAVVSALRRYTPPWVHADIEDAYDLLAEGTVGLQSDLALITVGRVSAIHARVRRACEKAHDGRVFGILPGPRDVTFLVEQRVLKEIRSNCQATDLHHTVCPVSAVRIKLPRDEPSTGMAFQIILNALSRRGLELLEMFSSSGTRQFVVPNDQVLHAYDVLLRLRATPESSNRSGGSDER